MYLKPTIDFKFFFFFKYQINKDKSSFLGDIYALTIQCTDLIGYKQSIYVYKTY